MSLFFCFGHLVKKHACSVQLISIIFHSFHYDKKLWKEQSKISYSQEYQSSNLVPLAWQQRDRRADQDPGPLPTQVSKEIKLRKTEIAPTNQTLVKIVWLFQANVLIETAYRFACGLTKLQITSTSMFSSMPTGRD